jgi:hypothetical protein
MKNVLLSFAIILFVPAFIFASELRVQTLGYGWLIPDEYVDVLNNPARINNISGNIFTARLDNSFTAYWEPNYNVEWPTTTRAAFLGEFGALNAGIICNMANNYYSDSSYISDTPGTKITCLAGTKIDDKLSAGISISVDFDDLTNSAATLFGAVVGIDYKEGS